MDASTKVEAGRKLLQQYQKKKKKGKAKVKKNPESTADNGGDVEGGGLLKPEQGGSDGAEGLMVTQSLPSTGFRENNGETMELSSLPVATPTNNHVGVSPLVAESTSSMNAVSGLPAGNLEVKDQINSVTSFVGSAGHYNNRDNLMNSAYAQDSEVQDHNLDGWETSMSSSLPVVSSTSAVTGSLSNGEKPLEDSYGHRGSTGLDLHHLTSTNQELESTNASLGREVEKLREQKNELLNRLEALRESSFSDMERARRETSSNYEHQITTSQQAMLESEHRLQEVELQLEESKRACKLLEDVHAQEILDRDQNHARNIVSMEQKLAEEVAQVREESRGKPIVRDADEEAAEWMKVIKDKMREMHEDEKQELIKKHLEDMKTSQEEFQKKIDQQQQQMQAAANEQFQAFYQQCLKSYQTVEEENRKIKVELDQTTAEVGEKEIVLGLKMAEVSEKNTELEQKRTESGNLAVSLKKEEAAGEERLVAISSLEIKCADISREKDALEEDYQALLKKAESLEADLLHKSDAVRNLPQDSLKGEGMGSNSSDLLEKGFKEWNEAALKLDEKLSSPEKPDAVDRESQIQNEKEIKALHALVGEYEAQQMNNETKHLLEIAQINEKLASAERRSEEYENHLREMKEKQHQEVLQLQSDSDSRLEEALLEARQEKNIEIEELNVGFNCEVQRLKDASAAAAEEHHCKLSQLEEDLASVRHHRDEEKAVSVRYKEELQSLRGTCEDYEKKLSDLGSTHAEELSQLQSDTDEHMKSKVLEIHRQNERNSEEVISRYEADIQRLRVANAADLNESIDRVANAADLNVSTDRASLEVAEEHMMSLREQLNGFRNQEQSYQSRLTEMEKNHSNTVAAIRKKCEEDNNAAISQIEKESRSKIEKLKEKVSSLAKENELMEAKISAEMKESHRKELEATRATMKAKMEKTISDCRCELQASHQNEIQHLRQQLTEEFDAQKQELETEMRNEAEQERALIIGQKDACIEELNTTHCLEVSKLNDTISRAEEVISERFAGKIASLQENISKLESDCGQLEMARRDLTSEVANLHQQTQEVEKALSRVEIERNQLSEDYDRYEKKAKMLEVEASISKSAEENVQKLLQEKSVLLEENHAALEAKVEEVNGLASSLDNFRSKIQELEEKASALEIDHAHDAEKFAVNVEEHTMCKTELEGQLAGKGQELAAMQHEVTRCLDELAKKERELQCCREDIRISTEKQVTMKQELETRNAEYQTFIGQLAAKNQAFVDLQVENDSLQTSLDSLKKRHQEEVEACEVLKIQLQGRWGESEEIESLKQQVAELISYKDGYGDILLKVESLREDISGKERVLAEKSQSMVQVSQRSLQYEEENANYIKMVSSLQHELQLVEESKAVLKRQVQSMETVVIERSHAMKDMEQVIGNLERKIEQSEVNSHNVIEEASREANRAHEELRDISSKLKVAQNKEKLMLAELQEKEEAIGDLNMKLRTTSKNSETQALKMERQGEELGELGSRLDAASKVEESLRSQLLEKEQAISRLNSLISLDQRSSNSLKEMAGEIQALQAKVNSLELDVVDMNAVIEKLNRSVEDLQEKLSVADEEISKLEDEKSRMQQDLLQYQSEFQATGAENKWLEKCSELERIVSALDQDKESLETQLEDLQSRTSHLDVLEAKVKDQEKTIADLRTKMAAVGGSSTNDKAQLRQDLPKNPLGATLTRARKTLAERLQEKDTIEKELRFRRAKLERQLAEKQCLEHLLFEKKRFELELQNQKSLLKKELEELERKNNFGERVATNELCK